MSGSEFVKSFFCFHEARERRRGVGRGRADGTIWQPSEEESEWRVFYAHQVSYPLSATENTRSRSQLPHWHYFVCNLLILKGGGFKTGLYS